LWFYVVHFFIYCKKTLNHTLFFIYPTALRVNMFFGRIPKQSIFPNKKAVPIQERLTSL
jgi:hypothetical protein